MEEWTYGDEREWLTDEEKKALQQAIWASDGGPSDEDVETVIRWASGVRKETNCLQDIMAGKIILVVQGPHVGFYYPIMNA